MRISPGISAIVGGGASGLGAAVAEHLAGLGVRVAILDLDKRAGKDVAARIGGTFCRVDVRDSQGVAEALAKARRRNGQERICVNCAGMAPAARTVARGIAHDPDLFRKTLDVNLVGTFNIASQSALGMSMARPLDVDNEKGVIINTASIAAFEGQIGQVAYAASKAGIVGLTLPMARDLARFGIRVVAVAPGVFRTPMVESFPQQVQEALAANVPHPPRLGHPAEFAELVAHIITNTMLNGEVIRLDGATRMQPK